MSPALVLCCPAACEDTTQPWVCPCMVTSGQACRFLQPSVRVTLGLQVTLLEETHVGISHVLSCPGGDCTWERSKRPGAMCGEK